MDNLFIIDECRTYQHLNFITKDTLDITLPKLVDNLHNYNISFAIGSFIVTFQIIYYKVIGPNRVRLEVKRLRCTVPDTRDLRTFTESYYDFIIVSPTDPLSGHLVYGSAEDLYNCDLKDRLTGYWIPIEHHLIMVSIRELGTRELHYVDTSTGTMGIVGEEQLNVLDDNYLIKTEWFHIYYI